MNTKLVVLNKIRPLLDVIVFWSSYNAFTLLKILLVNNWLSVREIASHDDLKFINTNFEEFNDLIKRDKEKKSLFKNLAFYLTLTIIIILIQMKYYY
jgi:hypothetical protein